MSNEDNSQQDAKLGVQTSTLKLNRSFDSSRIQQSFTHGRSKTVTVEVKRKRFAVSNKPDSENTASGEVNSRLHAIKNAAEAASQAEEQRKIREREKQEQEEIASLQSEQNAQNEQVIQQPEETLVTSPPIASLDNDYSLKKSEFSDSKKKPFTKSHSHPSADSYAETEALKIGRAHV